MHGKIIVTVEEIGECESSFKVNVDLHDGSPEEVGNICHRVADSLNAFAREIRASNRRTMHKESLRERLDKLFSK